MPLAKIAQTNFAAGMFRTDHGEIPESGAYDLQNLLIDFDGSAYRRGGSTYVSTATFGTKLTWLWYAQTSAGIDTIAMMSDAKLGVLDNSLVPVDTGVSITNAGRPVVINGVMYIPGPVVFAGSRKTAFTYSTGTVAVTAGSQVVTGTATSWSAGNASTGDLIRINGTGPWYSINNASGTSMALDFAYQGATASGLAYEIRNAATTGVGFGGFYFATIGNRLVVAAGTRVYFSAINDPSTFNTAEDYHEIPDGADINGLQRLGETMLVFTSRGVWAIEGLALDLTDSFGNVQQTLRKVNGNILLWDERGIVEYENAIIVPASNDVWLFDSVSSPRSIGWQIAPLLRSYRSSGYRPGIATVFDNHYFLPIVSLTGTPIDLLVCRLDRPVDTRLGTAFPWMRWTGFAAQATALTVRFNAGNALYRPRLYAAIGTATSRVIEESTLTPDTSMTTDADASSVTWQMTTRDYPVDGMAKSLLKKLRLRYQSPDIVSVAASNDYGRTSVALTPVQGGDDDPAGTDSNVWRGNISGRHLRFVISGSGAASRMVLRAVELLLRPKGRQ